MMSPSSPGDGKGIGGGRLNMERELLAEFLWGIEAPRIWTVRRNRPVWLLSFSENIGIWHGEHRIWTPQYPALFNGKNTFEDIIVA